MQDERSQQVTERFFQALQQLKTDGKIAGKQPFCNEMGINRRHFWILENNKASDILKLRWLTDLCLKYNINADWLLTGRGNMYL